MAKKRHNEPDPEPGPEPNPEQPATPAKPGYSRREQMHYDTIREAEKQVRRMEYQVEMLKAEYKVAKDGLHAAQVALRDLIHNGPTDQMKLPGFEQTIVRDPDDGPRWRSTPIEFAIHDPRLAKLLKEEHGIKTVGALADYTNAGGRLTELKGIGEHGEAKIVEQMQHFWELNPDAEPSEPPKAEPAAPAEAAEGEVPAAPSISPEQAYVDGQTAYGQGKEVTDNPHPSNTPQWMEWRDGFLDSQFKDNEGKEDFFGDGAE